MPLSPTTALTVMSATADLTVPSVLPTPLPTMAQGQLPPVVLSASGIPLAVTGRRGAAFVVTTPCQAEVVVDRATPVAGTDVVIDPGHGGSIEEGATGPAGLKEKDVNLAVASELRAALERAGVHTLLTRTRDYPMTIEARARIVRNLHPRAFVSIHHNAEPEEASASPGTETYFQVGSADSKRLSGLIWEEVAKALGRYRISWAARRDAGAKPRAGEGGGDYYGILRLTHGTPSSLAELAYISNPPEEAALARPDFQQAEAAAAARAVVRFLSTADPGSGFVTPSPRNEPAGSGGTRSPACVDPALD
ncbi:MAG: hypothetical protein NVS3B12_19550 [Acidimicrobiales bacterium]